MDHRSKTGTAASQVTMVAQKLKILVVVEWHWRMKKAVVVPWKGSTGRYAARAVIDLIEDCGDHDRAINCKMRSGASDKVLSGCCVHVQDGCQDDCRAGAEEVEGFERHR